MLLEEALPDGVNITRILAGASPTLGQPPMGIALQARPGVQVYVGGEQRVSEADLLADQLDDAGVRGSIRSGFHAGPHPDVAVTKGTDGRDATAATSSASRTDGGRAASRRRNSSFMSSGAESTSPV